MAVVKTTHCIY